FGRNFYRSTKESHSFCSHLIEILTFGRNFYRSTKESHSFCSHLIEIFVILYPKEEEWYEESSYFAEDIAVYGGSADLPVADFCGREGVVHDLQP
ncbi:MAG: hypothetical protein IJR87_13250, partial [Bacteroidaceae bacterium]|nr:hypothetical protein [Bacteroidaceae bacterium]